MPRTKPSPAQRPDKIGFSLRARLPWIAVAVDARGNVVIDHAANGFDARNKLVKNHDVGKEDVFSFGPNDWDGNGRQFLHEMLNSALKDEYFVSLLFDRLGKR